MGRRTVTSREQEGTGTGDTSPAAAQLLRQAPTSIWPAGEAGEEEEEEEGRQSWKKEGNFDSQFY